DSVRDSAHAVLANAEPQVSAGLVRREVAAVLDDREVRFGQVRRAAEELRHWVREGLDGVIARVARRDLLAWLIGLEAGVPVRARLARQPPLELARVVGMRLPVGLECPVPFRDQLVAPRRDLAHLPADILGHEERAVRIPAVELLREADL